MTDGILEARRITAADAARAYELVAMSRPGVSKLDWARYLRTYGRGRRDQRGLVALEDSRGCIHALFSFTVQRALDSEAALQITELATARLPGTVPVRALIRFANALALEFELPAILLDLEPSSIWALDAPSVARNGYTLDRVTLRGTSAAPGL